MNNVIPLRRTKLTADEVLEEAKGRYADVVVLGYDKEGNTNAWNISSDFTNADMVYLLEGLKLSIYEN